MAAVKIGGVLLNLTPVQAILLACLITATYSALSGLLGVLITDFFLYDDVMQGVFSIVFSFLRLPSL